MRDEKGVDDMIFIILIYANDLLIFAMALEMDILRALLTEAFKSITRIRNFLI